MNLPSSKASVGLHVIRSADVERLAACYAALGFQFVKHSHPPCGEHDWTTDQNCVFEICQRRAGQRPTKDVFFGLNVSNVDHAIESARLHGGTIRRSAEDTEWGRSAIIRDLDRHRVMLSERS